MISIILILSNWLLHFIIKNANQSTLINSVIGLNNTEESLEHMIVLDESLDDYSGFSEEKLLAITSELKIIEDFVSASYYNDDNDKLALLNFLTFSLYTCLNSNSSK